MRCKTCGKECDLVDARSTCVAYHLVEDTEGFFHLHDYNGRWEEWRCMKGHTTKCTGFNSCWCGWSSQYPEKRFHVDKEVHFPQGHKFGDARIVLNDNHIVKLVQRIKDEPSK
jgi:hypothetical protein